LVIVTPVLKPQNNKIEKNFAFQRLQKTPIGIRWMNGKKRYFIDSKKSDYEILGFVNCYQNTIPTRVRCPVCATIQNGTKAVVKNNPKEIATHLTSVEHDESRSLLTIEQGLAIIELISLSLQLKIIGDKI